MKMDETPNFPVPGDYVLPAGWRWVTLASVCDGIFDCPHSTPILTPIGPLLVRTQDILSGVLDIQGAVHVSEETYQERIQRAEPRFGDLLYSREGTYFGIAADVPRGTRVCLGQRMVLIRPINGVSHSYIRIWLNSLLMQSFIVGFKDGTVAERLNLPVIRSLPLALPPRAEQDHIVSTIASFDDKIDLNRRINQTLEAMAQSLFQSWFVDFDPVKAKVAARQEGRDPLRAAMSAISGKTGANLDALPADQYAELAATAALFPDAMVESELGEIPAGWVVERLSSMIHLIGGGTPRRSEPGYWGGDLPWFSVKDVPEDGDIWAVDTEETITELGLKESSTQILSIGTTIITARGTVGKLALVGRETAMNQSCYGVIGADNIGSFYNYFNLRHAVETLKRNTHGAVFDTITQSTFETVLSVNPSGSLHSAFENRVAPFLEQIRCNVFENQSLVETRDTLLPNLLSGELSVIAADEGAP